MPLVESARFGAEAVEAIRTVSSLTLEEKVVERYGDRLRKAVLRSAKRTIFSTIAFALSDCVDFLAVGLVFWYGGRLVSFGELSVSTYFIIYTAIIFGGQGAGFIFGYSGSELFSFLVSMPISDTNTDFFRPLQITKRSESYDPHATSQSAYQFLNRSRPTQTPWQRALPRVSRCSFPIPSPPRRRSAAWHQPQDPFWREHLHRRSLRLRQINDCRAPRAILRYIVRTNPRQWNAALEAGYHCFPSKSWFSVSGNKSL